MHRTLTPQLIDPINPIPSSAWPHAPASVPGRYPIQLLCGSSSKLVFYAQSTGAVISGRLLCGAARVMKTMSVAQLLLGPNNWSKSHCPTEPRSYSWSLPGSLEGPASSPSSSWSCTYPAANDCPTLLPPLDFTLTLGCGGVTRDTTWHWAVGAFCCDGILWAFCCHQTSYSSVDFLLWIKIPQAFCCDWIQWAFCCDRILTAVWAFRVLLLRVQHWVWAFCCDWLETLSIDTTAMDLYIYRERSMTTAACGLSAMTGYSVWAFAVLLLRDTTGIVGFLL